ncbi:MAG: helix-turn-helix transcriptional regulator [Christensenellales bacterium]
MNKLKDLINERTEPIRVLAKKIKVSPQTIANIMNGKQPSLLTVKKICAYFKADYKDYI